LKRRIATGEIVVADVILTCPAQIEGMPVSDLLMSQRHWGRARCRRYLTAVPLSENKTIGSMTERQRHALAGLLTCPQPTVSTSPFV
jgi:hypothetical protein